MCADKKIIMGWRWETGLAGWRAGGSAVGHGTRGHLDYVAVGSRCGRQGHGRRCTSESVCLCVHGGCGGEDKIAERA